MKVKILFDRVNHFHALVRIKDEKDIAFMPKKTHEGQKDTSRFVQNLSASGRPESVSKRYKPINPFSHLFNACTKAYNKRFKRTGCLFEHSFKQIPVPFKSQLLYLIYYIHHNLVHHGFCENESSQSWYLFQSSKTLEKFFYAFCE